MDKVTHRLFERLVMAGAPPVLPTRNRQPGKKFWQFRNTADGEAELLLYGVISETTWYGDEVTPKQFLADLAALGNVSRITVRINSDGGDVFAAEAIATNLRDHPAYIVAKVDGIAASAAVRIVQAAGERLIPASAFIMVHKPLVGLVGYYYDHELDEMSEYLGKIKQGIIIAYAERTGKDRKTIEKLINAVTWYTGEEAVAEGFADKLMFQKEAEPSAVIDGNRLVINGVAWGSTWSGCRRRWSLLFRRRPGKSPQQIRPHQNPRRLKKS